jgi:hypothetical protein
MIIQFDWTYRDGTLFTYREPTYYDEFGSGRLLLSPGNNVELIFESHELLQPSTREFSSYETRDVYELRWDADLPISDDIEGQITFDTLKLCTTSY